MIRAIHFSAIGLLAAASVIAVASTDAPDRYGLFGSAAATASDDDTALTRSLRAAAPSERATEPEIPGFYEIGEQTGKAAFLVIANSVAAQPLGGSADPNG